MKNYGVWKRNPIVMVRKCLLDILSSNEDKYEILKDIKVSTRLDPDIDKQIVITYLGGQLDNTGFQIEHGFNISIYVSDDDDDDNDEYYDIYDKAEDVAELVYNLIDDCKGYETIRFFVVDDFPIEIPSDKVEVEQRFFNITAVCAVENFVN